MRSQSRLLRIGLLLTFIGLSLFLGLGPNEGRAAAPFQSPPRTYLVHEPLVTNQNGLANPAPDINKTRTRDVPISVVLLALLLLFASAVAFVGARRRVL